MGRKSLRDDIVAAGLAVMLRKGYAATSVRDVVAEAGVPQGSFTNHFRSKEAFVEAVLERYFEHVRALVAEALDDPSLGPRERLLRYLDIIAGRLADDGHTRGCLIGDLSAEAAPVSAALRARLSQFFAEWRDRFAECIAQGQAEGAIDGTFAAGDLADFLLASWQGAILRMKVERDAAPLVRFRQIASATFLKECS